jgi:hypothetical protein
MLKGPTNPSKVKWMDQNHLKDTAIHEGYNYSFWGKPIRVWLIRTVAINGY